MAKRTLNIKTVDGLEPGADEYTVWDDTVPGFGVRVSPGGTKTFVLKYIVLGRQRKMALGRLGEVTVEQARRKALGARGQVADGLDPQASRDDARKMTALDDAWARFIEVKSSHWRPTTTEGYQWMFGKYIRPALGNRPVGAIDTAAVAALHHKLRDMKRTANLVLAVLSSFMTFCKREGLYSGDNPCKIERFRERPRERVLSDDEIARLGSALDAYQGNIFVKAAIRLTLLLGCRKMEVLTMRWTDVDLAAGIARLPETKTGARTVYLGDEAIEILSSLPRFNGNPYVIPGEKPGEPLTSIQKPWKTICKAAGIENATIHDLRRTYGSKAISDGADLYMVSKLLGHASVKMTESAYAFMKDETKAAAARDLGNRMSRTLTARRDNVVKIGGRS